MSSSDKLQPITFRVRKPIDPSTGQERDQTDDAARHMRYAHTLNLPELKNRLPRMGRAIIVGGGPSLANELPNLKRLALDHENAVFALNFSHNWLLERGVVPYGCVLFEIDVEPDAFFASSHPDVIYFICSHCHEKTFDQLAKAKRVLWHSPPNSPQEEVVAKKLFPKSEQVGGGIGTFLRTITVAMFLGYRNFELFGCDSSFPEDALSTHVDGYKTANKVETDAFVVTAIADDTGESKRFKTVGYLALQIEEFKEYCRINHEHFALRVHGDTLLRFVHENTYPCQYT
jgi:hypothetical protein